VFISHLHCLASKEKKSERLKSHESAHCPSVFNKNCILKKGDSALLVISAFVSERTCRTTQGCLEDLEGRDLADFRDPPPPLLQDYPLPPPPPPHYGNREKKAVACSLHQGPPPASSREEDDSAISSAVLQYPGNAYISFSLNLHTQSNIFIGAFYCHTNVCAIFFVIAIGRARENKW
jgi:hypothetical protein